MLAALIGSASSPLISVGGTFIDATPRWLKEFAIETFGENDKTVLLIGIGTGIALLAALLGVVSVKHRRVGVIGVLLLGVIPAIAAVSRPTGSLIDAVPALVGATVGAVCLHQLIARLPQHGIDAADAQTNETTSATESGLGRRSFLRASLAVATIAAVGGVLGRAVLNQRMDVEALRAALRLPVPAETATVLPDGFDLDTKGLTPFFTPNGDFYRVDTALTVPAVNSDDWSLRIHGMVDNEVSFSFSELLARPMVERDITLTCVSNEVGGRLLGTARWLGVRVQDLLEEAGVATGADQVVSRSYDGMTIGTPTAALLDGRDALLAVGMNGEPLPLEHGFPVRMVVPGLYGYVSACKWIVDMEVTTFDAYDAYWVERGWERTAPIKVSSRIDTPKPLSKSSRGSIVVAGVAWAQQRGIKAVDVRVDGSDWTPAKLASSAGIDTWRQWTWDWDAQESGNHTLEVRATDGDGTVQTEERAEPFPSGSTGWHSVVVTVE
ncbi:MAG: molybdopterin-dependent oxidoreductase [Actinomycetes bacterium]